MDYQTIYRQVMRRCYHKVTETTLLTDVKEIINDRYHQVWAAVTGADPTFGRANSTLTTVDDYTTGTVTTNSTTTIIGSGTTFISGMVGRKFKLLNSWIEVYTIAAYVSATEITLDKAVNDDADSGLSYVIYDDELTLPSDCNAIVCLRLEASSVTLTKVGLREMRSKQVESPFTSTEVQYNDPKYYTYANLSTIIVYPAPTRQINIKLDYTKKFTELVNPEDEPILPIDYHRLLVIGSMADLLQMEDYPGWKDQEAQFQSGIGMLKAKNSTDVDLSHIRLSVKRT